MQALRAKAPSNLILSAVGISPFNGNPMPDVSAFANVLDHVSEYFISLMHLMTP